MTGSDVHLAKFDDGLVTHFGALTNSIHSVLQISKQMTPTLQYPSTNTLSVTNKL